MTRFNTFVLTLGAAVALWLGSTSCTGDLASRRQQEQQQADANAGCTLTQGYWKNHDSWPVSTLVLGSVSYTQVDLVYILRTPVRGNGLVSLAHQLIAAKLDVAAGAASASIGSILDDADALIGSLVVPPVGEGSLATSQVGDLVAELDAFNNGLAGPSHCDDNPPPPPPVCGDGTLDAGEQCDDGNVTGGDGCSSTCTIEVPPPPPCCGNGIVETGEQCDDGNTTSGDGCSATCTTESSPVCGNGIVEGNEQCDDGNTIDTDACSNACTCNGVTAGTTPYPAIDMVAR